VSGRDFVWELRRKSDDRRVDRAHRLEWLTRAAGPVIASTLGRDQKTRTYLAVHVASGRVAAKYAEGLWNVDRELLHELEPDEA